MPNPYYSRGPLDPEPEPTAPVASVGAVDVDAAGNVTPTAGGSSIWSRLGNALRDYGPAIASAAGAGLTAGAGSPAVGAQYAQTARLKLRQMRLQKDLEGVDPRTPEGLHQAMQVFMRHGEHEAANQLLGIIQQAEVAKRRADVEALKAVTKAPTMRQVRGVGPDGEPWIFNEEFDPATQTWTRVGGGPLGSQASVEVNLGEGEAGFKQTKEAYDMFRDQSKNYVLATEQWERARQAYRDKDNPQAYQALGVIYQKMLDPTSVVRESEFGRSEGFQPLMQRLEGALVKLQEGTAPPGLMEDVMNMVDTLMVAAAEGQQRREERFRGFLAGFPEIDPDLATSGVQAPQEILSELQTRDQAITADMLDAELRTWGIDPEKATDAQFERAHRALLEAGR